MCECCQAPKWPSISIIFTLIEVNCNCFCCQPRSAAQLCKDLLSLANHLISLNPLGAPGERAGQLKHQRTTLNRKNTPSLEVDAADFLTSHHRFLEKKGVFLELGDDFDHLAQLCAQTASKAPLNAFFDPELVDLPAHRGLWIVGRDADGELVHVQAVRCDDLDWTTLADWWRLHFRRLYKRKMGAQQHPVAENMTGRIVFHGEFWVHRREARKLLSPALGRYAQVVAMMRWRPDYIYGLTSKRHSNAGFAARMGYKHKSESAVDWGAGEPPWDPTDHMAWNDWCDLVELVNSPPSISSSDASPP